MRRALFGELEGTCITRTKSDKVPHECSTIVGIEESVHEILMNLKNIVFRTVLIEPVDLCIELKIERGRGYCTRTSNNYEDRSYPINVVFMPVRNVNHSIHSYRNENEKQEILFLEI
ncbi:DNA-directed RNA polymerase subunit alpha [Nymphaea thermarum]|nr:DNA-directed RNA polymerase subunit alpha [Nymphaea thermarum]